MRDERPCRHNQCPMSIQVKVPMRKVIADDACQSSAAKCSTMTMPELSAVCKIQAEDAHLNKKERKI